MRILYSTIVWNTTYLKIFTELTIPSLLTNKQFNLNNSEYYIATNSIGQKYLENNKNYIKLKKLINIKFYKVDFLNLESEENSKYNVITNIQKIFIIDAFKNKFEYFFFIYPDSIYSNGFIDKSRAILKLKDVIMCPSLNVNSSNIINDEFVLNKFSNNYLSSFAIDNLSYFHQSFMFHNLKSPTVPLILRKMNNDNLILNGFFYHPAVFKLKLNSKLLKNFKTSIDEQHIYKSFIYSESYYLPLDSQDMIILSIEESLSSRNQISRDDIQNKLTDLSTSEKIDLIVDYGEANTIKINRDIFAQNYQVIKKNKAKYSDEEISIINLIYSEFFLPDSYLKKSNYKRYKSRINNVFFKEKEKVMLSKYVIRDREIKKGNFFHNIKLRFLVFRTPLEGFEVTLKDFMHYLLLKLAFYIRINFPSFYYFLRKVFPNENLKKSLKKTNLKNLSFFSVLYLLLFKRKNVK